MKRRIETVLRFLYVSVKGGDVCMNWSGAKNWLIILFLGINIFLVFTLVKSNIQSSYIDKQTIEGTVDILAKSGITVAADIIPNDIPKLGAIDVENSLTDFNETAKKFLGEGMTEISEGSYRNGSKRFAAEGDMIYYVDSAPSEEYEEFDEEAAQRAAVEWLRECGFDIDMVQSVSYRSDEGYIVHIEQKFDKYVLLDSYFNVTVTPLGISEMEGSWFVPSGGQDVFSDSARVKSSVSVLLDFARDSVRISRGSNVIEQISLGYTTGEKSTYHKYAAAMPVWRIKCSDGNEYYFEAR